MGPENSSGQFVVYIDGQPVEIGRATPEITVDHSADGVSAAAAEAAAAASRAWKDLSITVEIAAESMRAFFDGMELAAAVWLARVFKPELVRRYIHTKKKRTRKKYEKRIRNWYRETIRKCLG